jgi:L-threonylcarbamoyladenylate synthase
VSLLEEAIAALRAGEVVGVPTDTVYGLAVDPLDATAVGRLFEMKGRPSDRPVPLLVASRDQAGRLVRFTDEAGRLADRHWPGALTLVLPVLERLPDWVGDPVAGTVAVRMPAGETVHSLLEAAGPLAVTSANRSGDPPALDEVGAEGVFGDAVAVYLPGTCPGGTASTVVDARGPGVEVLRQGPIRID